MKENDSILPWNMKTWYNFISIIKAQKFARYWIDIGR